jgi:hypothetical protein
MGGRGLGINMVVGVGGGLEGALGGRDLVALGRGDEVSFRTGRG